MTKREELAVLDKAIAALGESSYLGPWLASVRAEVASIMTADGGAWWPVPSYTAQAARELMEGAQARAAEITAQAERKASDTVNKAQRDAKEIRYCAAKDLRAALAVLEVRS